MDKNISLLKVITDRSLHGRQSDISKKLFHYRTSVRTFVFNKKNQTAIMNVAYMKYHKLPGGGVKSNENLKTALKREVMEEVGCTIEITNIIGAVMEVRERYKNVYGLVHLSYCYVANVKSKKAKSRFTKKEKSQGYKVEWVPAKEVLKIFQKERSIKDYFIRFKNERELTFMRRYLETIK